jgi:polyisoprenoid-binding protein YceI
MITNVKGEFSNYSVNVETENEDFMQAKISFEAEVGSINTGNEQRDAHLRGADFFDAEKFPKISFEANGVENVDNDGSYELLGNLTIKGISRPVRLDVEFGGVIHDLWGGIRAGFTINAKINRTDWGLVWNAVTESGGLLVSETVNLSCEIELVKQI